MPPQDKAEYNSNQKSLCVVIRNKNQEFLKVKHYKVLKSIGSQNFTDTKGHSVHYNNNYGCDIYWIRTSAYLTNRQIVCNAINLEHSNIKFISNK